MTGISGDLAPKILVGQETKSILATLDPEVETLLGDPSKHLNWAGNRRLRQEMCKEMVIEDHKAARRLALLKEHDLELPVSIEN